MVIAQTDIRFVPKSMLPATFKITKVTEQYGTFKGKSFQYFVFELMTIAGEIFQYECKYGDKNFMINTAGPDSDTWIGIYVHMGINEKGYKQLVLDP